MLFWQETRPSEEDGFSFLLASFGCGRAAPSPPKPRNLIEELVMNTAIAYSLVATALSCAADAPLRIDPEHIEFSVHQVGPAPLPYQAVEVRLSVRNISKMRIGPPVVPVTTLGMNSSLLANNS